MYEYIRGEVAELTPANVVIEAGGIGYMLNISLQTYSALENASNAKIYLHYIVRDEVRLLFGFASRDERELFRLLIGVSGVGGNTARMILSTYTTKELAGIISTENDALLRNVKGLGLKTAQKIIVELKDKVIGKLSEASTLSSGDIPAGLKDPRTEEALAALTMLGFPRNASDKVLRKIIKDDPGLTVEELIRAALKNL